MKQLSLKNIFQTKVHPVIKTLIINNILCLTGWAFINPIFAVFVLDKIIGSSLGTIGVCYFIYFVVKGVFQLVISNYLDKTEGEVDDYFALLFGQFLNLVVPLLLLFSQSIVELYLIFFLYGIADALYVPPWNALFTRYINPKRVSFEWSLNSTGFNFGSALAVLIGSSLAAVLGFPLVFIFVAFCQLVSFLILLPLKKYFYHQKKITPQYYFPLRD